jgi:hypothetical protein
VTQDTTNPGDLDMTPIELLRRDLDNVALRNNAIAELESLLIDFGGEDIPDDGSYAYDDSTGTAERYMLAGGGPSAWAVFIQFARDDVTGYLEYADSQGTTIVHIPSNLTDELRSALRRDAKARNAR